jgi:hypothetical protein
VRNTALDTMSRRELEELKGEIEQAIRAAIRRYADRKTAAAPAPVSRPPVDLATERDAWLARRKG